MRRRFNGWMPKPWERICGFGRWIIAPIIASTWSVLDCMSGGLSILLACFAHAGSWPESKGYIIGAYVALWWVVASLSLRLVRIQRKQEDEVKHPHFSFHGLSMRGGHAGIQLTLEIQNNGDNAVLTSFAVCGVATDASINPPWKVVDLGEMRIPSNARKDLSVSISESELDKMGVTGWILVYRSERTGKEYRDATFFGCVNVVDGFYKIDTETEMALRAKPEIKARLTVPST